MKLFSFNLVLQIRKGGKMGMKKNIFIFTCTICFMLVLLSGIIRSLANDIPQIELELKYSFPQESQEEEGMYLFRGQRITTDDKGNIYIVSRGDHEIQKFDITGRMIGRIGREGQGPGEFRGPTQVVPWNDKIVVMDNYNRKFQIFNRNGEYEDGFLLTKFGGFDFTISKDGIILMSPYQEVTDDSRLIHSFSLEGYSLGTFGKPMEVNGNRSLHNETKLAFNDEDELFVAFRNLAVVRKYSLKGELLGSYEIEHKKIQENALFNRTAPPAEGGGTQVMRAIDDIHILNNKVFLFFNKHKTPKFEILELDENMKIQTSYFFTPVERHRAEDFLG